MRKKNWVTVSAVAMAWATPAIASSAAPASGRETAEADTGEILVTARRVEERSRDVPISITAISADTIEQVSLKDSRDLQVVTPGLRVEATGVYVQPAMRGVTTNITTSVSEPNVATYIDGVYQPFQVGAVFELPDIQSIQVLKGPQGTLFGRNATGGAILITTKAPDLNNVTGKIDAHYERFNGYGFDGVMSAPLVQDRVAISLAGQYYRTGPFVHDLLQNGKRRGDDRVTTLRGKLRFLPWEGADFTLTGYYNRRNSYNDLRETNLNGDNRLNTTPLPAGTIIATNPWEVANDVDTHNNSRVWSVSLTGGIDIGPGKLTSTTAYLNFRSKGFSDIDNTNRFVTTAIVNGFNRVFSQELIYATGDLGRFNLVVGGNIFNGFNGNDPTLLLLPTSTTARYVDDKIRARALFGEATFKVTDWLKLIGGIRYSYESREDHADTVAPTAVNPRTLIGKASFDSWTPRVSLVAEVTSTTNVYATYSKGFKSGIFNTTSIGASLIKPEDLRAFEIGVKHRSGPFSVNLAGFYYDYRDIHAQAIVTVNNVLGTIFQNVPKARIYGIELESTWTPVHNLTISANGQFLDAKYKVFPNAAVFVPTAPAGNVLISANVAGKQMIRAPRFSGNIMVNYGIDTSEGRVEITGNIFHSSTIYDDFINRVKQPPYTMLNGTLSWEPTEHWRLSVYGRNLLNQKVISSTIIQALGDHVTFQPPATYGVEASFRF